VSERPDPLLEIAAALSDGAMIDWDAAEAGAATDGQRVQIRNLRLVRGLADAHSTAAAGASPLGLHESLLHPAGGRRTGEDQAAPVRWGPLDVIEKIGQGKFGDVYRARDSRLDRDVALKLLRRRIDAHANVGSHVIEEGRLLAKVRHPNVVTVHGAERIDDRVGVWMEHIAGRTLEDELNSRGPLPAAEILEIGIAVCGALSAVHRAGLLHRDVKAQNVMRDHDGRIVLMDFGTGSELKAASPAELAGTPLYLAPEVLAGAPATPRADIYGAGVLLHHLATGAFPVHGRTLREIRAVHALPPDVQVQTRAATRQDAGLDAVIAQALARDPHARFASAADMAAALAVIASASTMAPARSRRRRMTMPALALTAAAALLLIAVSGLWRMAGREAPTSGSSAQQARQAWTGREVDASGSVSPEGRYLTFTNWDTGDLAIHDFVTGSNRNLTHTGGWGTSGDYASESRISADGKQVAVAWFIEGGAFELRVLPSASTNGSVPARTLLHTSLDDYSSPAGWTPDGGHIVVLRSLPAGQHEIGLAAVADGSYRTIKKLEWRRPGRHGVALSPDGRFIAYDAPAGERGTLRDIYVVSIDGSVWATAVQSAANDAFPLWSPDGTRLLFLSDRTGTMSVWSVPVNDGRPAGPPVLLKADVGRVEPVGMTGTGALYYLVAGAGRQNVQVVDLANLRGAAEPSLLTDRFVNANIGPDWSHDGTRVAYYSLRPAPTLVVRTPATGEERDFALPINLAVPFYMGPKWFPGDDSVLIMCRDGGVVFQRFDLSSGKAVVMQRPAESNLSSYALAPDGSAIFYVHQHVGTSGLDNGQLVRFDIAARRERILQKGRWFISVAISPDGTQLAYVESIRLKNNPDSRTVIGVMPSAGGAGRAIFADPGWFGGSRYNSLGWAADSSAVLFVREDGALWSVPAGGGAAQRVGISMKPRIKTPAVSPDGRRLVFGSVDTDTNEVWALENFLPRKSLR
jgi:Tol biopolymer transport system component/tRNA A-37 threonylcarbamoyl transferase component Bud32